MTWRELIFWSAVELFAVIGLVVVASQLRLWYYRWKSRRQ